ncbi:MAG: response regulator [Alistipes sp.]
MQNELFSRIPEYLPLGLIIYNTQGRVRYANNAALKMFGVEINDILDLNIFDDPNITDHDKALLKQGIDVSFETDYDFDRCRAEFAKTSTIVERKYFVTKVTIMRDETGEAKGYLLNCEDVTAKKAQQQEVIQSYKKIKATQRELALALEAGNLSSWDYHVKGNVFYKFSAPAEQDEKWSFDTICERIHPHDRARFVKLVDDVVHKIALPKNNIELEVINDQTNSYRHYNFVYSIREDDQGEVVGITFIQRDITEDIKYRQNLIKAKNRAEEADKLKSRFLATMSHEIRTPLNAIVGFSQLLAESAEIDEKNEYKQLIETNSEILLKLIGDILDLSKIEAGSIDINRQPLDLTQLCQELFLSFKQRLNNPKITLRLEDPYAQCTATLDRHRFTQIFTNFVSNAIKYTPSGEIVMGYECAPGRVRFYVKDTGIGIADEKKYRIFSRFEKLDDFAQGTGLGLSICKAIADATGGKIGFESQAGKGSEFWYVGYTEIDYVEKTQTPAIDIPTPAATTDTAILAADVRNLNILVAEDNDSNFLLLKSILKENHLTRALTGAEAVEKGKTQSFDVIFMDLKMPIMDGLTATTLIRKFDLTTPIIALTANAFHKDKAAALAAGCNYFMTKPIKKHELHEFLSKLWIMDQL